MTKLITIAHVKLDEPFGMYDTEMRVVQSNHPQYKEGSRFDFGYYSIAIGQGYMIVSIPPDEEEDGES